MMRSSFSFRAPAIDMSEDEKAYKISAELPGIDAKDIDVSVSGDMLVLKGEKRQEEKHVHCHVAAPPVVLDMLHSAGVMIALVIDSAV